MIMFFQISCLSVTLYVLQKYATMGTYSRTHRLLPLILGLIGVYNFYEIVQRMTGAKEVFTLLKDLLLLQMLFLLVYYILDFLETEITSIVENVLFVMMIGMDVLIFIRYGHPNLYARDFLIAVLWYVLLIIALGTYAYIRSYVSRRKHHVANLLYIALLLPAVAVILEKTKVTQNGIVLSGTLVCSCLIVYYLIVTEQLNDNLIILQENQCDREDSPIIFFDEDYYYLGANKAARRLFPDNLSVIPKKSRAELYRDDIRKMAKQMDKSKQIELNGCHYKCLLNAVYQNEQLKGYSLLLVDITEQKKDTKRMERLKDAAENQTEKKSRFLATMSHDLRSPLHAIIGICDILVAKREISARNRAMIYHIRSAGDNLLTQVDAILDYSKLEAGRMELTKNTYHMDVMIEELAHTCAVNLQSKPVKLFVDVLDDHPRRFIGDEMRVREIILNLLSNAVKFTEEGEIRCEITCKKEEENQKAYICCSVSDTGSGMSREQIDQIFEEYVTFSGARKKEGAGLGLCIVKQLTELMGGSVTVSSDGKTGSTFTASFYQEYCDDDMCEAFSLSDEMLFRQTAVIDQRLEPTYVYPQARVLVADDMRINQEIFKELVVPWKFKIDFVVNGREAVEAVRKQKYQLIFLDQMMPEMLGDEAADIIRGYCETPIIMMTANSADEIKGTNGTHSFNDFLAKPVELLRLKKMLEDYIPKEYRCEPRLERRKVITESIGNGNTKAYQRTLETFVQEMKPLLEEISGYAQNNLEMFRVKTHGIKGASRQIGKVALSESAEIMEMAAKTENIAYIQSHMKAFEQELGAAIQDISEQLVRMPLQREQSMPIQKDTQKLFAELKEGFDTYEIGQIEKSLYALEHAILKEDEMELLERAKDAYHEFDYEAGSALFS